MFNVEIFENVLERGNDYVIAKHLRYLCAYWPDVSTAIAADKIYDLLDSTGVGAVRALSILRKDVADKKTLLSDLRLVLKDRKLSDPSQKYQHRLSIRDIQLFGLLVNNKRTSKEVCSLMGITAPYFHYLDSFLRMRERLEEKNMEAALIALTRDWSVREFAERENISHQTASLRIKRARLLHKKKHRERYFPETIRKETDDNISSSADNNA